MKKLLSIALCICLTLAAVFVVAPTTKVDADTADAHALLSAYYNNGTYTKETHIFAGESQAFSSVNADDNFHAKASQHSRTTEYTPGRLYMTTDTSNGGYKDVGSDMVRFHLDGEVEKDDFTVKNTSVQEYFTDLFELATVGTWEFSNGVYTNTNAVWQWVHFIAPMWDPKTEVVTFTKVEMSTESVEGVNRLVLELYGETTTVPVSLFAKAIITPGVDAVKTQTTTIAELGWTANTRYLTLETEAVTVTMAEDHESSSNTGNCQSNGADWRAYAKEEPSITATGSTGYNVVGIAVTYTINSGATLALNETTIESDEFVPVSNNTITFGVNGTEGHIRITAITVYYTGGCDHTNTTTTTVDATCTEDGLRTVTCDDCGAKLSEEIIEATDHTWDGGICTVCGAAQEATKSCQKATSIAAGDTIVIVCESKSMELTSVGTSYGIGTAYTEKPEGTYTLSVVTGASTGTYAFVDSNGNYLSWTSSNSLKLDTSLTANTSWKVTFEDGDAIILNAADNTRKLRWNASAPRFACYTSDQTAIQIYKYAVLCDHTSTTTTTVDATCGKAGSTTVTCDDCNAIISTEEIPATGAHTYAETGRKAATCTEAETITETCSTCGDVKESTGAAALGHTTENGECERCHETIGGTEEPAEPVLTATMKYTGSTTSNMTADNQASVLNLDESYTVIASKGGNTLYPGLNKSGDFRLYNHANGGNSIEVTTTGDRIIKIKITYTSSSYDGATVLVGGEEVVADAEGYYLINGSSFVIRNDKDSQIRIKTIDIYTEA